MFRCDRLSASLRVQACGEMWQQANGKSPPDRLWQCKGCPLGAQHAGAGDAAMNPLRGTTTCTRCHRTDMRLIGGIVCVSCANRAYEWRKGKNARGVFPKHHPELVRFRVRYATQGEARVLEREAAGVGELVVELLKDSETCVVFGMGRGGAAA
jgi:hypothetical protein